MSRTEDEKLAALLEKELDSLLARTPDKGTEPESVRPFVTHSEMPWGKIALRFNIGTDERLWGIFTCLRAAGIVEMHTKFGRDVPEARKITSRWFAFNNFLEANEQHPLILRLIQDPTEPGLVTELQATFPVQKW